MKAFPAWRRRNGFVYRVILNNKPFHAAVQNCVLAAVVIIPVKINIVLLCAARVIAPQLQLISWRTE